MKYRSVLVWLLCFMAASQIFAQEKPVWKEVQVLEGNCGLNLKLYVDSSYFLETGCEHRSSINLGSWEKKGETIRLIPKKPAETPGISDNSYEYKESRKITILDQKGAPVSRFDFLIFDSRIPIEEVIEEAKQMVNATGDLEFSEIFSWYDTYEGSTSDIQVHEGQVLFFFDLYQLTGEKLVFSPEDINGKHLNLTMPFPAAAFDYPALSWYELPAEYIRILDEKLVFLENPEKF